MRNVKKFLALVLAMLMVVSAAATVSAFEDVADDHVFAAAINDLTVKEIVNGYDGETFGPDDAVTRQQMALMMARAITGNVGDDAVWAQGGLVGFEDVTEYQYAIATVVKAGIVDGFLDNTFRPEEGITFVQALKMAVCALGYDDGNLEWWNGYYNVALDLGLTENLNYITDADKALNRGEVAQLIYNMLYVELADGSDCFASQNFGLATATNLTTFVITATDEQTAAYGMDVAEGGYVGIQALVNGLPDGDVYYIPVELFGFEEDEDEDYFLHAYNLVNWDAKNGSFSQIIPTGTYDVIYNADITVSTVNEKLEGQNKNYKKIKYDGVNYYAVDELSGTAIRNEVVIFNATNYSASASQKQLFLNADGQVLDPVTGEVVLEAVYSVTGDIVSYRELRGDNKGTYLSVTAATAKYGVDIGVTATPYTTMSASGLSGAYQLTIFDDDMDGKMDRAYYTPVYMSVKDGFHSSDNHLTAGPFQGWDEGTYGKITGMEDLAEGDVFVYTFNEQLKEVTVLDVLEVETGTVKKIDTTKTDNSSYYYTTITLTDGTALKMWNATKKDASNTGAAYRANLQVKLNTKYVDEIDYDDEDGWIYQITDNQSFGFLDDEELLDRIEVGSYIKYFAYNGYIVFAETYNIDEIFERVVLHDVVDADLEAIYLDVYRAGEVEEIAVTKIWSDTEEEYVTLADLSWLKISKILGDITEALDEGNIYRISELDGAYQMSEVFDGTDDSLDAFKLYEAQFAEKTGTINFEGNVALSTDKIYDTTYTANKNRIRTDEDTVWYFINGDEVKVFSGELEEAYIKFDKNTHIYADKLGYSGVDKKGIANEVYVFDAVEAYGFGWGSGDTSVVYMVNMNQNQTSLSDYYTQGSAEEVGLDPDEYKAANYYMYSASYSIDLNDGTSYVVYSSKKLDNLTAYVVDSNGVVDHSKIAPTLGEAIIMQDGISWDESEFRVVEDYDDEIILDEDNEVEDIYVRNGLKNYTTTYKTKKAIENKNNNGLNSDSTYYTVKYLTPNGEDEDGVFVMVITATTTTEPDDGDAVEGVANGYWYIASAQGEEAGKRVVANTLTADTDMTIKGDIKLYAEFGTTGDDYDTKGAVSKTNLSDTSVVSVLNFKKWDASEGWVDVTEADLGIKVTVKDGTITVTKLYYADKPATEVELEAGAEYRLAIEVNGTAANAETVLKMRAEFAVPAAE